MCVYVSCSPCLQFPADTNFYSDLGSIQQCLIENGTIEDVTRGKNELKHRWIAESNFDVFCQIPVLPAKKHHVLRCSGVDAPCEILLDDHHVGSLHSEFVWKDFPLDSLKVDSSALKVRLLSPIAYCQQQYDSYSRQYGYKVESSYYVNGIPNFNFLRKASCSFGWDWGPCVPTMGIADIGIISYDHGYITDAKCLVGRREDGWHIRASAFLVWNSESSPSIRADLCEVDAAGTIISTLTSGWLSKAKDCFAADLHVSSLPEWRVAGSGTSPVSNQLYKVFLTLEEEAQVVSRSVGFRTVELVRVADRGETSPPGLPLGESFYLTVNGTPIFAKGSNYIPPGLFGAQNFETSLKVLRTAVDSGMNCLRIWGGGRYESDEFYVECDRLGILLWHDFMFACSLFPSNADFLDLVALEIRQQLRRLAGHPCIAIWAGNNENEELLQGLIEGEKKDLKAQLLADYDRLYIETILPAYTAEMKFGDGPDLSSSNDTADETNIVVPFWPSSPSNGLDRGGIPGDQKQGDVHYWGVWHGNKPFEAYQTVIPRFCSEFGFQSAPSYPELASAVLAVDGDLKRLSKIGPHANDLSWTCPEMEYLQRSPARGNLGIISQMSAHLRIPTTFVLQVWASQLLQGLAMQNGISTWRRLQPYCMGTLYWQLNDIWTGMSWSTINHSGSWKLSQYFIKRAFAKNSLSFKFCSSPSTPAPIPSTEDPLFCEGDNLELWLTTDHHEANRETQSLTLRIQAWSLSSSQHKPTQEHLIEDIQLSADSRRVWSTETLPVFGKHDIIFRASLHDVSGEIVAEAEHVFLAMKKLHLQPANIGIKVSVEETDLPSLSSTPGGLDACKSRVSVLLVSDCVALYVSLPEIARGWHGNWDDNGFILYPGEARSVSLCVDASACVLPLETAALEAFIAAEITHVQDSFAPRTYSNLPIEPAFEGLEAKLFHKT